MFEDDSMLQMRTFIALTGEMTYESEEVVDEAEALVESAPASSLIISDLTNLVSRLRGIMESAESEDYVRGFDMAMQTAADMVESVLDAHIKGGFVGH